MWRNVGGCLMGVILLPVVLVVAPVFALINWATGGKLNIVTEPSASAVARTIVAMRDGKVSNVAWDNLTYRKHTDPVLDKLIGRAVSTFEKRRTAVDTAAAEALCRQAEAIAAEREPRWNFLLGSLQSVVAGGDIDHQALMEGIAPTKADALHNPEAEIFYALSQWADDENVRRKEPGGRHETNERKKLSKLVARIAEWDRIEKEI